MNQPSIKKWEIIVKKTTKISPIATTTIFSVNDSNGPDRILAELIQNQVFITSLHSIDFPIPVIPTAGSFSIFVKTTPNGGFHSISDNGVIAAANTGGLLMADGLEKSASFNGSPLEIKIVPSGVDVALAYEVTVMQLR